ncbi:MAG TPA: DUF1848 domain-containing protein [Bacillota bacterium]|jgi:hypothetical protein|nr:DUF1848 domain-containing protein [Bacillota bacterium]HOL10722.1 DUF1848 domain-containing protein [Bacillota bacterium]HPO98520.1 DUF1848 domain-containing protein [Bacillota bacterium]
MIISVSRRTDIPAFYSDWFFKRLEEGFVLVRNPMNPQQVSKVSLSKAVVDCFVFWTKNPKSMLEKLPLLAGYDYYFQFTLNPYDQEIEVNLPKKAEIIKTFIELSNLIGKDRVIWRYDPILLTDKITIGDHLEYFNILAGQLGDYTRKCVISFLDQYQKTERNTSCLRVQYLTELQMRELAQGFVKIAKSHNLIIETCAEKIELADLGINHGKCIDDQLIAEISGAEIEVAKDKSQRKECGCVASIDIGAYNTCNNNCLYCYANFNQKVVLTNLKQHNKDAPLLVGELTERDVVREREMVSCKVRQSKLF